MSFNHIKIDNEILEFINFKLPRQFTELKTTLDKAIEFFNSKYIQSLDNNYEKWENDFYQKYNLIITDGYKYIFLIKKMLDILSINSSSQTDIYNFKHAAEFCIGSSDYLSLFNSLYEEKIKLELETMGLHMKVLAESKIEFTLPNFPCTLNTSMVEVIDQHKHIHTHKHNYMVNVYINTFIFQFTIIKLILKDVYIY